MQLENIETIRRSYLQLFCFFNRQNDLKRNVERNVMEKSSLRLQFKCVNFHWSQSDGKRFVYDRPLILQ